MHPIGVTLTPLGERPPEHFEVFNQHQNTNGKEVYGKHQGVFEYRFDHYADETVEGVHNMHYWALRLWDAILLTVIFHDPACCCCLQDAEQSKAAQHGESMRRVNEPTITNDN
jgi:hypothetical protein